MNLGKWGFHTTWIYAQADEPANGSGHFFNHWTRSFVEHAQSSGSQSSSLGWEMDYGATFRWDDAFTFDFEFGAWFPGDYYLFDNTSAHGNTTLNPVFATNLRVGVQF